MKVDTIVKTLSEKIGIDSKVSDYDWRLKSGPISIRAILKFQFDLIDLKEENKIIVHPEDTFYDEWVEIKIFYNYIFYKSYALSESLKQDKTRTFLDDIANEIIALRITE